MDGLKVDKTSQTIVIIGTLDTKGAEVNYLRQEIARKKHRTIVIDPGVLGKPAFTADITREQVAEAGGRRLQELIKESEAGADRVNATQVMMRGLVNIVSRLYSAGDLGGIISLGGSTGTALGTAAMKILPLGLPKIAVATYLFPNYIGEIDITVMQTPADLMGLNVVMRRFLSNAAGAICSMVATKLPKEEGKPLVAMTALGVTTSAVMNMQPLLYTRGFETIVFHGKSELLDWLVTEKVISAVMDITSFEWLQIFIYPGTPERESRLESTLNQGIPLIIVPGGLDMFILRMPIEGVPERFWGRKLHRHGPQTTLVRTNREEVAEAARIIAGKANQSRGPVAIVVPRRGFSEVDKQGQHFCEPETDMVFIEEIKKRIKKGIVLEEVDSHINDESFAEKVITIFDSVVKRR